MRTPYLLRFFFRLWNGHSPVKCGIELLMLHVFGLLRELLNGGECLAQRCDGRYSFVKLQHKRTLLSSMARPINTLILHRAVHGCVALAPALVHYSDALVATQDVGAFDRLRRVLIVVHGC